MNIRLEGTTEELKEAITQIKKVFTVVSQSKEYPNRRVGGVRIYLEVSSIKDDGQPKPEPGSAVLGGKKNV